MSHSVTSKDFSICSYLKLHPAFDFQPLLSSSLLHRVSLRLFEYYLPTYLPPPPCPPLSLAPSNTSDSFLPTTSPFLHSVLLPPSFSVGDLLPDCSACCCSLCLVGFPLRQSVSFQELQHCWLVYIFVICEFVQINFVNFSITTFSEKFDGEYSISLVVYTTWTVGPDGGELATERKVAKLKDALKQLWRLAYPERAIPSLK